MIKFQTHMQGEMLTYEAITNRMIREAKRLQAQRDKRGIRENLGPDRWIGRLGEIVFGEYLDYLGAEATWFRDEDRSYDFIVGEREVDVKTQSVTGNFMPSYGCNVVAKQIRSGDGDYFFCAYDKGVNRMWLCGGMSRNRFVRQCVMVKKGERSPANPKNPPMKTDGGYVLQKQLLSPYNWTTTLPATAWPALAKF